MNEICSTASAPAFFRSSENEPSPDGRRTVRGSLDDHRGTGHTGARSVRHAARNHFPVRSGSRFLPGRREHDVPAFKLVTHALPRKEAVEYLTDRFLLSVDMHRTLYVHLRVNHEKIVGLRLDFMEDLFHRAAFRDRYHGILRVERTGEKEHHERRDSCRHPWPGRTRRGAGVVASECKYGFINLEFIR